MTRLAFLVASILVTSCGGGGGSGGTPPPPPPVTYTATSGVAQKGPLIQGSTVTAQELDSKLSPTGKQYSYQILTNLGTFSPTSTFGSQYIGLNATGYYFDEVANAVSTGTVTLNGYSDLTTESILNINLLTTLAYQRIQHLVTGSNMAFAAARTQAENEVLAALNIPMGSSYGSFSTLDVGGGTDGDHILAAISSLFVYGNSAGPLSQLIANFQSDIGANGVITSAATKAALTSAGMSVNPAAVAANLTQAYSSIGVSFSAADISNWIDQNGDGVVGNFKFQVADATPSSTFTFPAFVVSQIAGTSVSVTAGQLSVNGTVTTGAVTVHAGDLVVVSPAVGAFPNGVLTVYLMSGTTKVARVSFVSALLSIAVTPNTPSIAKGLTEQFKATGTFSDASTADLTNTVNWTSGTPAIASVNATSGLATSVAIGSTVITATSGTVSGSATLNVTAAVLEAIAITPNPLATGIGIARQLTATGTYSDASSADITTMATWASASPSVATVNAASGLVTGATLGSTAITATSGLIVGTAQLSVTSNTWAAAGSYRVVDNGQAVVLLNTGKAMLSGGGGGMRLENFCDLYDPISNTWSPTGNLTNGRWGHTATLLANGKVLVAGGFVPFNGSITSAELYDPATGAWSAAASLLTARGSHTATLLPDGRVLAAGGVTPFGANSGAELYDPTSNSWSAAGNFAPLRTFHTATLLANGQVLVIGGTADVASDAQLYDPPSNTWSAAASPAVAHSYHTATLLPNGKVLVVGGLVNNAPTSSAELYDPVSNTWTAVASLSIARDVAAATLLPNGKVLVAGGIVTNNGPTSSAELYDPASNTWSMVASLLSGQEWAKATLLPNGEVLIAGGDPGDAEVYWP